MAKEKNESLVLSGAELGKSIVDQAVLHARKKAQEQMLDYAGDLMLARWFLRHSL